HVGQCQAQYRGADRGFQKHSGARVHSGLRFNIGAYAPFNPSQIRVYAPKGKPYVAALALSEQYEPCRKKRPPRRSRWIATVRPRVRRRGTSARSTTAIWPARI